MSAALGFEDALRALKKGTKVARAGWNGKGQWVVLVRPDDDSVVPEPLAYTVSGLADIVGPCLPWAGLRNAQGEFVPWLPSQGDLFAEDWEILP